MLHLAIFYRRVRQVSVLFHFCYHGVDLVAPCLHVALLELLIDYDIGMVAFVNIGLRIAALPSATQLCMRLRAGDVFVAALLGVISVWLFDAFLCCTFVLRHRRLYALALPRIALMI